MPIAPFGIIPATIDQVILGDVDRSRSHKVKAIFMIGVNDGVFPSIHKEEGFFNDKDRAKLKENGIELAKGTTEKLYEENFNIYKAFTTAEQEVFLSYTSSDNEGKALRPSILISRIKKIFPLLKERNDRLEQNKNFLSKEATFDELLNQIAKLHQGELIDNIWYDVFAYYREDPIWRAKLQKSMKGLEYSNLPDQIREEIIEKLYGNVLKTSVSKLEQYRSCPFSFFLKYGLKLEENRGYKIEGLDTGSFMHEVIDSFFSSMREKQLSPTEIQTEQIKHMVEEIIQDKLQLGKYYIFSSSSKFRVLTKRLVRVITTSLEYILEGLKKSDFQVVDHEVEFKTGAKYAPIVLELENNKKVEITGKIDRVDMAKNEDGTYLRIIDYKSSVRNMDLNEVVAGLQIQLLTYLDATCKIEDVMPAGVLYFSLIDPMIKSNKLMSKEEIEIELRKKFKMQGLILADVKVVQMMDKNLQKGGSDVVPAYLDKEGKVSQGRSNAITKEQFENLQKYIQKKVKEIASEILTGNIDLKPYYNTKTKKTPCEYCHYRAICSFQKGFCHNDYHYIGKEEKSAILEKIKKQV